MATALVSIVLVAAVIAALVVGSIALTRTNDTSASSFPVKDDVFQVDSRNGTAANGSVKFNLQPNGADANWIFRFTGTAASTPNVTYPQPFGSSDTVVYEAAAATLQRKLLQSVLSTGTVPTLSSPTANITVLVAGAGSNNNAGTVQGTMAANTYGTVSVTFSTAFSAAPRAVVLTSMMDNSIVTTNVSLAVANITAAGFLVTIRTTDQGTTAANMFSYVVL